MQLEGLRLVVRKFIEDGAKANIKRWSQSVELTACRTGLLLCGDLEIARKIIGAESQAPGDLPPQDKLKELVVFSVYQLPSFDPATCQPALAARIPVAINVDGIERRRRKWNMLGRMVYSAGESFSN